MQSCADFQSLVRGLEKLFDFTIIQQCQRLLWVLLLLLILLLLLLLVMLLWTSFKTVLELLLNGDYLIIKGVVVVPVVKTCIIASWASCLSATNINLVLMKLLLLLDY